MKKLMALWRSESATIVGILIALINASVIHGSAGKILGAVLPLLGAGAVRQTVFAPATVTGLVHQAATDVATQLGPDTVGHVGALIPAAQAVADGVASGVLGQGD